MTNDKQKELAKFKKSLEGKTLDELKAIEKEIIKEADAVDKKIAEAKFKLPVKGQKETFSAIRTLLDKQTIQWQYTLGMMNLYDAWNPDERKEEVEYPVLDAMLRTLGALQFTGHEEWRMVLDITDYFEPIKKEYVELGESVYDVANKHNEVITIIEKLEALEKPVETTEDTENAGEKLD